MMRHLDHNPKVVALVGMGPSIVDILNETLTQECSPNWVDEIWAINMVCNVIRSDMIVWMDDFHQQQNFKPGLFDLLRKYGTPVLTSAAHVDVVPNAYDYPIDEVARMSIPYFGKPYLTNGVAMGVAYALHKGVKVLKIYGCDFTYPNRNFAEEGRACVEAWIALASMKGMEVQLSPSTSLFDNCADGGIYGYAEQPLIEGPGGVTFRYEKQGVIGKYMATDSSGANNDAISGYLPRTPGRAPGDDRGPAVEHGAGLAAAGPVEGPGEGVHGGNRHGRAEAANPSGLDGGGAEGSLPRQAF